MANANKFLEELEKQKKKRKAEGKDTSSLEPMAPVRTDLSGSSKQVDSFFNALNTEREKLRRREEITESFDIAPTVGSVSGNKHGGRGGSFTVKSEEDDSLLDFFDRGAISDGYQFGDVAKTILGTVGDIGVGAVKGVMKMGEGIGDAATYGVAAAADALGFDDNAEKWRKNAQRSAIDDNFAPVDNFLDRYSVLGRTLDSASEAVGQIGGIIATGGLAGMAGAGALGATAATTGVMGLSSFGSSTGEAYKGGAEEGEAELYGAIAGTADAVTELIFGGLGKAVGAVGLSHGLSSADDILAKKLSEKITNTIAKNAVQFGVKASGEGAEEVLAGLAQAAGKKLTYMSEEELGQIIADENLLEQFVVGAMASGVAQVPSFAQANKTDTDFITGRTKNEQAVIDRVVEQRVKDAETDGKKLKPKERQAIEEQAAADMERGRIEIDTIEEVLGGDEYKAYQDAVKEEDALRKEYEDLGALKEPTLAEKTRFEELHGKVSDIYSDERRTAMKTKLSERVAEMAKSDRLSESYAERSRRGEYFAEDVSKYKSDAAKKTVQNLVDSKIANNTGRTHDMVETVAKIAEDKGIVFNFTNNQKLRESGKMDAVADGVTINGYKDADGITVNLDSPKAWEFIVGHEVTHALEGTAEYTALADAVKVYAQTKGEYDSRRDAITSLYAEGTDVDSELTADMVGELFTDEQFVQDLSVKHQNVFQRVFAEIKHLVRMVTAGSKEARQLEKVKHTFEKAYRAQQTQGDANTGATVAKNDAEFYDSGAAADDKVQYSLRVTDPETREFLDNQETITTYKTMQIVDGKLYPPMAARIDGQHEDHSVIGEWEQATEHPELIKNGNKFKLDKGKGNGSIEAAYNPYMHSSNLVLNDQFSGAYTRDNLVTVECVVPVSEMTSGYHAEFAKDSVGWHPWHTGTVAGQVRQQTGTERKVFLSRWIKPVRIVPDSEVAAMYKELLDGTDIAVPDNVVTPSLLAELKKAGIKIKESGRVQYSLSQDSEGRQLSEGQREYFRESKVTDEDGNLKVMYHGTPNGDFTVFRDGTYFTDSREYADKYQQPGASSLSVKKTATNPKTFEVYLDIKKPFDLSDPEAREIYINDYIKGGNAIGINPYLSDAEYDKITSIDWTEGEDLREFLQDNEYDYDGLILDEGGTGGYGDDVEYRGKSYVVFSPEQVKNVDNLNPTADPDIRFSLSAAVEESKNLIAVHNLNADKLMKSLALGGMPMPSIAIAKADGGHENFGDISLVFDKSTIDPQASAANKVYSGDAWTPTYPPVEYKVNDAVERRVRDKYYDLANRIGYDEARAMYRYAENLDDSLNRDGGEEAMLQRLYDDTGMMQIYLLDVGRGKVEPIMREVTVKVPEAQAFVSEYLIEVLGADLVSGIKAPDGVIPKEHRRAYMDAYGTEIRDAYKQMRMELYGDSEVDAAAKAADAKTFDLLSLVNNAYKYTQNGGTTVSTTTDTTATDEAIRAAASDGYREWVDGLFRGVQEKSGIRNQQDTFTKSGNRRSWEATHYETTLENVVRAMKESGEKGVGSFGGGNIFGASTQDFSSIEDIKKSAGRLQNLTEDEFQEIKRGFRERFSELAGGLPKNKDSFSAMDDAANMLVEAVVKYKTKKGIDGYLRRESQGWANYSPDVTEELISLVNDIRAMPTQYFEAKPQRAVSFDEVAAFVIPRNADIKVKQELLNRGYSIAEYDPDIEGDRAKVLNSFEQYKFSLSDAAAPVGGRGTAARELRYQGEAEDIAPVQQATADQFADVGNMVQAEDVAPITGEHSEIDRLNAEYDAARAEFDALSADVQSRYAEMTPAEQEQAMADVLAAGERLQAAHDSLNAEQQSALASYSDADVPPEVDAPYYGEEQEQTMPADPLSDRDEKEVGARSVKAYQYLNPEVKPYFRQEAQNMLGDLRRATPGERFVNWDTGGMGSDGIWTGQPRVMSYDLAGLKDRFGYSYEQLEKGIQAIIDDDGKENNAVSKRIELLIHDRLAHGYVDAYSGAEIPADTEYLDFLREREISEYNDKAFAALMENADSYAPPIAEDMAEEAASADAAPVVEAPTADDLAGVSSAEDTEVDVLEIKSTYDKILQKKQNAEAELEEYKNQRAVRSELYQTRIAELRQKLDRKKRKDTKAAVRLGQQIARLERLAADVDADYAKKISDAEKRIARRDFDLQQDHTEADKLERAYAKIDAQLATDRAAVEAEFAQRREELSASIADKNTYVSERAKELYAELSHLKKGVRASYELGYLLDHGYDWRTLKSTLLKVNLQPDAVINPESAEESVIREMLNEEYASKTFEIDELDGEMQDRLAELDADAEKQKAEVRKGEEKLRRKQVEERYMNDMRVRFAQRGYDLDVVLRTAKDVSGWKTVDKTPQRVNYAVFGDIAGEIMNDLTVNQVAQSETEGIRWLNQYTDPKTGEIARISKQYNIKPGSKESAAAQMYAEGFYVDEYDEIVKYGDRELAADFPDPKVQENIKGLARDGRIRAIYDATLDAINEVRIRNGYPEIPKRDNYYLHFREMGDFFSTMGTPFNPDAMNKKDLPTDINGMTVDNRPGKPYFASEHQRKGKRTSFDLLGGLEQYLTSAKDQIYHIDDIQRHRALRNYIADDYGQAKGLDSLAGLSEEEVQERIQLVFGNHLSTYAKFLNEEANILAGKTALIDRALEGIIDRRGMTFMTELNKQVGANQVGFNISSSLTNFIAPVQAFAKMNKGAFVRGFAQTVSNRISGIFGRGDNFADESPVMVRREGAKRFKTNWWQRRQDNAYALMGAVDSLTTEIITRAKFNELTAKGMDTAQAHYETDKWVSALMGDRSLGQMPQLFNSKTFGMILKYQLEVRNQIDSMFADTIREAKLSTAQIENVKRRNAVKAAKIASTFATLAVGQHIFGQVFESIAGYNPAFDIIEAIIKAAGWDDDEDDDDTVLDNLEQGLLSIAEDMPYYSILSGGRIPLESALPIETIIKGKDSYGNDVSRWKTAAEALPYYVLPGGYGQIKKTAAGLGMYSDEHPVAGSYTDSGNMRFPVGTSLPDVAQAAFFGQYSSANARDYFNDEHKPLSPKQVDEYAKADMTIQDYWRYRDGLAEQDKLADQAEYINSLDIPTWKKNLFINNLTDRKEDIDMADYDRYGSLEEMDFAKNNPETYKLLKTEGVDYNLYKNMDKDRKNAYSWAAKKPEKYNFIRDIGYTINDYAFATEEEKAAFTWAYENPDKYLVSTAVTDDLFAYRGYTDALNDIKADKDSEGKSISGSRKDKVVDYINGLDLDYGAKIILLKSEYPSEDSYNYDIIDYLNEREDITGDDKVVMLTALGFKVSDDGTVTWD